MLVVYKLIGLSVKRIVSLQSSISLLSEIIAAYTLIYRIEWQPHTILSGKSVYFRCSSPQH
ncbi:hypothetical protein JG687_00007454 [Phytophthora cactorum]|uniref:Uncharacterized protein n=1 Tax=Phytophthora cactorum TaxID=29920 RepID=A0A8T1UFG7_9STRA|nr:hypothetical protein JG687_00007454 [Phytophthora cactorum]